MAQRMPRNVELHTRRHHRKAGAHRDRRSRRTTRRTEIMAEIDFDLPDAHEYAAVLDTLAYEYAKKKGAYSLAERFTTAARIIRDLQDELTEHAAMLAEETAERMNQQDRARAWKSEAEDLHETVRQQEIAIDGLRESIDDLMSDLYYEQDRRTDEQEQRMELQAEVEELRGIVDRAFPNGDHDETSLEDK